MSINENIGKHAEKHGRKAIGSNPSGMTAGCPISPFDWMITTPMAHVELFLFS